MYQSSAWAEIPADETPLVIAVGDLVDTYTAGNTDTISMSVLGNQFTANVKLDTVTGGNLIQANENGLYVAPVSLAECMQLVDGATENNLASFDAAGQVKDAGVSVGGSTLAGTAGLLATEQAVQAAITALQTTLQSAIDGKIAKVASATANNVPTLTSDGSLQDSGKAIGGATLAGTPNANTLATEAAVKTALTAAQAALTEAINGKIAKAAGATEDNVATFTADGQVQDSGVAIGGATLAGEANATTLATEAAVKAAITAEVADVLRDGDVDTVLTDAATNDKVPTSKAVVYALTWSTTM